MKRKRILRAWSILFWVLSVALPTLVLIYSRHYVQTHYHSQGFPPEGMAIASGFMLLILASVFLCLIGFLLGFLAYRRLGKPRPLTRKLELIVLMLPMFLWLALAMPLFKWVMR